MKAFRMRALVAASLLVTVVGLRDQAAPRALTGEQQRDLGRGVVVVLPTLPPGASSSSQGGTALTRVSASADTVWGILVDYAGHVGLYPRVIDAQVLASGPGADLVRYVVGIGPLSFGFHVHIHADAGRRRLGWRLATDRPNSLFTDNVGYWEIEPAVEGVLLTYAMAASTVLPSFMTRGAEREGLVETITAVRKRAEQAR